MGRPKRQYPLGKYRLRASRNPGKGSQYTIDLEYTWNRQAIRKSMNITVTLAQWNQAASQGRGELRKSYGSEYSRMNALTSRFKL